MKKNSCALSAFGLFLVAISTASATAQTVPPVTHFLPTFAVREKNSVVEVLPSLCKPGEELVTQQDILSAKQKTINYYDVFLEGGISRANNARIVCRSGELGNNRTQRPVLEVACRDQSQFVYLTRVRGRSSSKLFLVCRQPRPEDKLVAR